MKKALPINGIPLHALPCKTKPRKEKREKSSRMASQSRKVAPSPFMVMVVALVVVVALEVGGSNAMEICNMDAAQLAGCLPAIRGPSPSPPSPACCNTMRTADLRCLCGYKDSTILRAVGVDPKLATALPQKCHLTPPPECSEP